MDETTRVVAGIRLEKAREDLRVAHLLIEQGWFRIAVSRAYYAVFAIASAALHTLGIERRQHSGIESAFNQYLIKPGLIEPEYGRIYQRAFKARQEADYTDFSQFTDEAARAVLADAERFVARVERYLREAGVLSKNEE